ncbi:neuronal tyrosine-phosphorylated phosphoinositide-3-kinase adapter 1 [Megalops cyprinoides]|uniref:neuronal tyrosine-phosphorylated phosphoinositide-3-kinase adapter 1 n=1 Tax=Megalops cyprinoides TaxID=118141 RepID=UPI00186457BC|nr:neuronal tyrosine-phosphorylated phosphoinositide-3-kinase adapter 1 [Megalops cyprinoides]XP_036378862.1 neuronal tyrosine-phosphorylated phosphoinositide-3-kinase adapter 1 [Megalops cyprinoides]
MSSGSAQDVAVEHFLRDIERRGEQLHCTVIAHKGEKPQAGMNLLNRKNRLDWRNRDPENSKKGSGEKDPSATVGKVRDLASFRRHFRMGFMTMPASQDLSPRPCASAMAPRSQSCHAVGGGGGGLENGNYSPPPPVLGSSSSSFSGRCPPAKPKRHPSTRLSSTTEPPPDSLKPPPATQPSTKHPEKRTIIKKSDSGEVSGKKVPPLKPKRSPNTQLSVDPPPPRVPPPATPLPCLSQEVAGPQEDGDEEPVYIEMVGQVFTRDSQNPTPHPPTPAAATTPDSDSDQSEAIYEEMKYSQLEEAEPQGRPTNKQDKLKPSKPAHSPGPPSSPSPLPHPPPSSTSKPKATVSISHSSPLPSSSTSSTPVPQPLCSSPQPPRAPTPFLLAGSKPQSDSGNKIPAPFPNLLQHRPPLLAFPQPAAASSGVGAQIKPAPPKLGTVSIQAPVSPSVGSTTPTPPPTSSSSKLPVPHSGPKDSVGGGGAGQDKLTDRKEALLGPAPALRARSHSTPLPPSSQSSSHYSHHHHHPHHHPSHYHHYRRPEKELPTSHSMKLGPQSAAHTPTPSAAKEGKSVAFLLKPDKRERDREREAGAYPPTPIQPTPTSTPTPNSNNTTTTTTQTSANTAPSPAPPPSSSSSSSSSQRPPSRSLLQRSHTPHPPTHALPAYKPPPSDSPLLWTYPSVGLRGRPPAYESLRGGGLLESSHPQGPSSLPSAGESTPKGSAAPLSQQRKGGSLSRDGSGGGMGTMQRKLSFSHGRETESEDSRVWNGSTDATPRPEKDEPGMGGQSGIPVRSARGGGVCEGGAGGGSSATRGVARSGLPLPCQPFPAFHQNGELGRSASISAVRQVASNVQRQSSLPPGGVLNQLQGHPHSQPSTPPLSHQQQQLQLHQQQLQQQLQLQLHYQHLAQLAQVQPPASGGATSTQAQHAQRDGKLLEVIERKRCLCREIKAHRRPDRSLCKQDSMPNLPSWRKAPEASKAAPPSQAQQAILWDTAI